jgi:2-C-methyl-D-erythritol 4-phosphate cytidylyltransferase
MVARAPQSFYLQDILSVHRKARADGLEFIDCCTMMSHFGHSLHTITGPMENIKITTPMDFFVFKALIEADSDPLRTTL